MGSISKRVNRLLGGHGDCEVCGAPSYRRKRWEVEMRVRKVEVDAHGMGIEETEEAPTPCPGCGRPLAPPIRVRGIPDKPRER
jgi:hypothetical protein